MTLKVKELFEKMVDYRLYGIVLLAVSVFFYLSLIIPTVLPELVEKYIAAGASFGLLLCSIFFLSLSKRCRTKLNETDEGQEYMINRKRP
ncbi:hypothetical protein GNT69_08685 [Bacillus sp. B15-48]|nr:hypothetical protein [Bacillus sp. B15-48]